MEDKFLEALIKAGDESFEIAYQAWAAEFPSYVSKSPGKEKLLKRFFQMFYTNGMKVGLQTGLAIEVAEKMGI